MNQVDINQLQKHIQELENSKADNVPLTRNKQPKKIVVEAEESPILSTAESIPVTKQKKPRKPKTAAQMEAFNRMREQKEVVDRQKRLDKKIAGAKALLEAELSKQSVPVVQATPKKNEPNVSESESETEVIVSKKSSKKPKRQIIIESSSDDDSVTEPLVKTKQFGKSHQNKSSIRVSDQQPRRNFFAD